METREARLSPEILERLQTPEGAAALAKAADLRDDPFAAEKLRRHLPGPEQERAELAAAAVEQARLRQRARAKFGRADEMWFASSLLEQASGEVIAAYRARRFLARTPADSDVGDFCCGLGADAAALAEHRRVWAVDRDPLALALTRANAAVLGVAERVTVLRGDLPEEAPDVFAAWIDPGRRETGRRTRRLEAMSPTMEEVLSLRERTPHLGIKLSPATAETELNEALRGVPHEREYLSVDGECRELALWLGDLASEPEEGEERTGPVRRATVLPLGESLAGQSRPFEPVRAPGQYLFEPDPAVIRGGLVAVLAERLGAWFIDSALAYLSADALTHSPFARCYRILGMESFSGKALAERLRQLEARDVVLKTRGFAADPETLHRQLRRVLKHGRPNCRPVVFLTRLGGRAVMIFGERLGAGTD